MTIVIIIMKVIMMMIMKMMTLITLMHASNHERLLPLPLLHHHPNQQHELTATTAPKQVLFQPQPEADPSSCCLEFQYTQAPLLRQLVVQRVNGIGSCRSQRQGPLCGQRGEWDRPVGQSSAVSLEVETPSRGRRSSESATVSSP